jgi:hypothetical protein
MMWSPDGWKRTSPPSGTSTASAGRMRIMSPSIADQGWRKHVLERGQERWCRGSQLAMMQDGELAQQSLTSRRELHQNSTTVLRVRRAPHEPARRCAVHKLHYGVMLKVQPGGYIADGRLLVGVR